MVEIYLLNLRYIINSNYLLICLYVIAICHIINIIKNIYHFIDFKRNIY